MATYICYRCNYSTNNKNYIKSHLNRKNICKGNVNLTDDMKKSILSGVSFADYKSSTNLCDTCNICDNDIIYTSNDENNIHFIPCEQYNNEVRAFLSIINSLKNTIKNLQEENKTLKNNQQNKSNNVCNNEININNFYSEKYAHIQYNGTEKIYTYKKNPDFINLLNDLYIKTKSYKKNNYDPNTVQSDVMPYINKIIEEVKK